MYDLLFTIRYNRFKQMFGHRFATLPVLCSKMELVAEHITRTFRSFKSLDETEFLHDLVADMEPFN